MSKQKIIVTLERPPIGTKKFDWRAAFEGCAEDGKDGFGACPSHAVDELLGHYNMDDLTRWHKADELRKALARLVFLHECEQEGIGSGQPKPEEWIKAVQEAEEALLD